MRRSHLVLVVPFVAAFVAACGGSAATSAPGGGSTPAPGASQAPAATPAAPGGLPAGIACAGKPTFSPSNPDQSLAPDPALISHFPAQIDGQPVTDVSSESWLDWVCYWGGDSALATAYAALPQGINVTAFTIGQATATVDGESIDINAYRLAGGDANQIVQAIAQLASQQTDPGTMSQVSVGGKGAYKWTSQDGETTDFILPSGDTLFVLSDVTEAQAGKVFAALQ